jgi:tetratricopeptide (TPR) repeat protein
MRVFGTILGLLIFVLSAAPAAADQNDPRLDGLFGQLREVSAPGAARGIEAQIWHLWITHEDHAVNGLMEQGLSAMNRRDYGDALAVFEEMIAQAPDFAEAWNKRATVNWLLGNQQSSLADIERTLALEPRHFGALSGRGLVYTELEEWDLALESFEAALAVHPTMRGPRVNAEAIRQLLQNREI